MAQQATTQSSNIDSILHEQRVFKPSPEFSSRAHIKSLEEYERIYKLAAENPEKFWGDIARELHWFKPWDKVLEWNSPWAKWFSGGLINLSYNCLDRHVQNGRRDKVALLWESEPGEVRSLTYGQLLTEVQKFANALKSLGVKKSDRVAIYMGMCPELPIAMLACARIGAPHSVIFGGFSANALVDRDYRLASGGGHHPGRRVPPRSRSEAEAGGGRSAGVVPVGEARHCVSPHRVADQHGCRPRPLVARPDGQRLRQLPCRTARCGASAVHPVHLRHHRQAEGNGAHHRRLLGGHLHHHEMGLRPERRRRLLVHGRHRLGHRPQLHRLRARCKTAPPA